MSNEKKVGQADALEIEKILDARADVCAILDQTTQAAPTIIRERKPNAAWSADLMARCQAFAIALCKSAAGAQPGSEPFAVYLSRSTGKPNLPNRESADAIIGCTMYHLRRERTTKGIVLQAVQLPEEGFGVFARKAGRKRRKVYASDVTF